MTATTDLPTATVQGLRDRAEIIDVCVRYARALDQRDWDLLQTCFEPDATFDYDGMEPFRGTEALVAVCRGALDPLDASQHLLGNHVVDVDGDEARSGCYLQAQHVRSGTPGGHTYIVAGTYTDHLRRGPDGWRITHRRLAVSWTDGNSAVLGS
jgi:3-phenylpropionate/cinnamic acid dioxygenase small subunit